MTTPTPPPAYQPGDIVNGHMLGADGQWHPVVPTVNIATDQPIPGPVAPAPAKPGMSRGVKIALGAAAAAVMLIGGAFLVPDDTVTPTGGGAPIGVVGSGQTMQEWAADEGKRYMDLSQRIAKVSTAGVAAADAQSYDGVATACEGLGKIGDEGLTYPDSPDPAFNRAWDRAMVGYSEAGTYAPLIRDGNMLAMESCGKAIGRGTAGINAATEILRGYVQ
jgi:hypothetical protein